MSHKSTFFYVLVAAVFLSSPATSIARQHQDYLYLSPVPDAKAVSPETEFVLIRFSGIQPTDLDNLSSFIEIKGKSSGLHPGTTKVASDGKTVIFAVSSEFDSEEQVTVSLRPELKSSIAAAIRPYSYQFTTSSPSPDPATPAPSSPQLAGAITAATVGKPV